MRSRNRASVAERRRSLGLSREARRYSRRSVPGLRLSLVSVRRRLRSWGARVWGVRLAPRTVGVPFGPDSDLDLALVSSSLFGGCEGAFHRWADDYHKGAAVPSSAERSFWDRNIGEVPTNLRRGFVDIGRIPLRPRYRESQLIGDAMSKLTGKLRITAGAPRVSRTTARVYRDWTCFARQVTVSLMAIAER